MAKAKAKQKGKEDWPGVEKSKADSAKDGAQDGAKDRSNKARSQASKSVGPVDQQSGSKFWILTVLALLVVGLGAVAWIVSQSADEFAELDANQIADVTFDGDPLDPLALPEGINISSADFDPMVGQPLPTMSGIGFDGEPMEIGNDGRPKAIYFLAHWCPVCGEEVDTLREIKDQVPDGIDIYGVAALTDPNRPNYPPQTWMAAEGFDYPTLVSESRGSASSALTSAGGTGVPYAVYVDSNNNVLFRTSGNVSATDLINLWNITAGS